MSDLYLGLMSGTSLDGIDAALVDLSATLPKVLAAQTQPFAADLRDQLLRLAQGTAHNEIELLGSMDTQLGELFATAALALLTASGTSAEQIRAIGSHGQTIRHRPQKPHPFTLQIGDPNIIAERTGITTVADFRRRDLAAGGQGAPLVPAFHAACFRSTQEHRAVLNIGGMANLTILPADPTLPITGFDTGPGNVLMDAWIAQQRGESFDHAGQWAATGKLIPTLLDRLMAEPYLQLSPPKSTGRELFHLAWLTALLQGTSAAEDIQSTLNAFTARSIATHVQRFASNTERLLVCGGGVHNAHLLTTLSDCLPGICIESTQAHGLDPDWIEAAAFAWMARETLAARPSNVPSVTGAHHPVILGGIYPGKITSTP